MSPMVMVAFDMEND